MMNQIVIILNVLNYYHKKILILVKMISGKLSFVNYLYEEYSKNYDFSKELNYNKKDALFRAVKNSNVELCQLLIQYH